MNLLSKMLIFNPEKRYTVKQCLKHPYFEGLHNEEAEPEAEEGFDWTWDNFEPTKEMLQKMVWNESLEFHPEWIDIGRNADKLKWLNRNNLLVKINMYALLFVFK